MSPRPGPGTRTALVVLLTLACGAAATPARWAAEWPETDFDRLTVDPATIIDGGPPRDGIPAIDAPRFTDVAGARELAADEPVIAVVVDGEARGYPLRVLMWHEIVNDRIGDTPVTVTYCPLCNTGIAFARRLETPAGERVLDFGVSGKLRHSDLIMYDRQTASWWQQFTGEAIAGALAGRTLTVLPSRVVPFRRFAAEHSDGLVLRAPRYSARRYGGNPYVGYDSAPWPWLYRGDYAGPLPPLAYVVAVGNDAWPLAVLRERGEIRHGTLTLRWEPGMRSALDARRIADGRDVGHVTVERADGADVRPVPHVVTFAFAFAAFVPGGTLHTGD